MRKILVISLITAALAAASSCADTAVKRFRAVPVKSYVHDDKAYTQGLFFSGKTLCESTGVKGRSSFRQTDLESGRVLNRIDFSEKYFVEGSVMFSGKLYILTWTDKVAFVYDAATLEYERAYRYPREGWGLTTDGKCLIASDGSSKLYFMDGQLRTLRTIDVRLEGRRINLLNELEYIDGKIWANVYTSDIILVINPSDGAVEATVDCSGLLPESLRDADTDVLNGIAHNPSSGKIYLTGKNWKRLYEIELKKL